MKNSPLTNINTQFLSNRVSTSPSKSPAPAVAQSTDQRQSVTFDEAENNYQNMTSDNKKHNRFNSTTDFYL